MAKSRPSSSGLFIRSELINDESLTWPERLLLAKVASLADTEGGCFASNRYFGEFLGISAGTAANMISSLRHRNLLSDDFFDGKNRRLITFLNTPKLHPDVKLNDEKLHSRMKDKDTKLHPEMIDASSVDEHEPSSVDEHSNKALRNPNKQVEKKNCDSPELIAFRQKLTEFQNEYAQPTTKKRIILNANAVRNLFVLAHGETTVCIEAHRFFQSEDWRKGRVDWTVVHENFNSYLAFKRNGSNKQNNGNGNRPPTPAEIIANRSYRKCSSCHGRGLIFPIPNSMEGVHQCPVCNDSERGEIKTNA